MNIFDLLGRLAKRYLRQRDLKDQRYIAPPTHQYFRCYAPQPTGFFPKNGAQLIAEERWRQVAQEGWTYKHDDRLIEGELSKAASCYAYLASSVIKYGQVSANRESMLHKPIAWPFSAEYWKPDTLNPIHDLVRAGALIAAEIDRLQRADKTGGEQP
jgi:hypothetical protein